MARVCQITGKKPRSGNNVSVSNAKTKRRFDINLKKKKFFLAAENRWIELRVSTSAIRTINKNGLEATLKASIEKGKFSSK
jgi:large subunit ribosomal protein L28